MTLSHEVKKDSWADQENILPGSELIELDGQEASLEKETGTSFFFVCVFQICLGGWGERGRLDMVR